MTILSQLFGILASIPLATYMTKKLTGLSGRLRHEYQTELLERQCAEWNAFRLNIEASLQSQQASRIKTDEPKEEELASIEEYATIQIDLHCNRASGKYEAYLQNSSRAKAKTTGTNYWIRLTETS